MQTLRSLGILDIIESSHNRIFVKINTIHAFNYSVKM